MNFMNSRTLALSFFTLSLSLSPICGHSEESEESYAHWDKIVTDLKSNIGQSDLPIPDEAYGLDDVKISFGLGLSFTHLSLGGESYYQGSGLLKGMSLQFGIDLFHPEFQAEGAFRNYSSDSLSTSVNAQVREFELRLVHSKKLPFETSFRMGTGLSARYLDLTWRGVEGSGSQSSSTPAAVFLLGVGRNFGKNLSIGPDLAYRTPFSGGSLEQSSMDFHLRANAIF